MQTLLVKMTPVSVGGGKERKPGGGSATAATATAVAKDVADVALSERLRSLDSAIHTLHAQGVVTSGGGSYATKHARSKPR